MDQLRVGARELGDRVLVHRPASALRPEGVGAGEREAQQLRRGRVAAESQHRGDVGCHRRIGRREQGGACPEAHAQHRGAVARSPEGTHRGHDRARVLGAEP